MTQSTDQSRRKTSRYARKRSKPDTMMYGPGCCAHGITDAQIDRAKAAAREARERAERVRLEKARLEAAGYL